MSRVFSNHSPHVQHVERSVAPCVRGLGKASVCLVHTQLPSGAHVVEVLLRVCVTLSQNMEVRNPTRGIYWAPSWVSNQQALMLPLYEKVAQLFMLYVVRGTIPLEYLGTRLTLGVAQDAVYTAVPSLAGLLLLRH